MNLFQIPISSSFTFDTVIIIWLGWIFCNPTNSLIYVYVANFWIIWSKVSSKHFQDLQRISSKSSKLIEIGLFQSMVNCSLMGLFCFPTDICHTWMVLKSIKVTNTNILWDFPFISPTSEEKLVSWITKWLKNNFDNYINL